MSRTSERVPQDSGVTSCTFDSLVLQEHNLAWFNAQQQLLMHIETA